MNLNPQLTTGSPLVDSVSIPIRDLMNLNPQYLEIIIMRTQFQSLLGI